MLVLTILLTALVVAVQASIDAPRIEGITVSYIYELGSPKTINFQARLCESNILDKCSKWSGVSGGFSAKFLSKNVQNVDAKDNVTINISGLASPPQHQANQSMEIKWSGSGNMTVPIKLIWAKMLYHTFFEPQVEYPVTLDVYLQEWNGIIFTDMAVVEMHTGLFKNVANLLPKSGNCYSAAIRQEYIPIDWDKLLDVYATLENGVVHVFKQISIVTLEVVGIYPRLAEGLSSRVRLDLVNEEGNISGGSGLELDVAGRGYEIKCSRSCRTTEEVEVPMKISKSQFLLRLGLQRMALTGYIKLLSPPYFRSHLVETGEGVPGIARVSLQICQREEESQNGGSGASAGGGSGAPAVCVPWWDDGGVIGFIGATSAFFDTETGEFIALIDFPTPPSNEDNQGTLPAVEQNGHPSSIIVLSPSLPKTLVLSSQSANDGTSTSTTPEEEEVEEEEVEVEETIEEETLENRFFIRTVDGFRWSFDFAMLTVTPLQRAIIPEGGVVPFTLDIRVPKDAPIEGEMTPTVIFSAGSAITDYTLHLTLSSNRTDTDGSSMLHYTAPLNVLSLPKGWVTDATVNIVYGVVRHVHRFDLHLIRFSSVNPTVLFPGSKVKFSLLFTDVVGNSIQPTDISLIAGGGRHKIVPVKEKEIVTESLEEKILTCEAGPVEITDDFGNQPMGLAVGDANVLFDIASKIQVITGPYLEEIAIFRDYLGVAILNGRLCRPSADAKCGRWTAASLTVMEHSAVLDIDGRFAGVPLPNYGNADSPSSIEVSVIAEGKSETLHIPIIMADVSTESTTIRTPGAPFTYAVVLDFKKLLAGQSIGAGKVNVELPQTIYISTSDTYAVEATRGAGSVYTTSIPHDKLAYGWDGRAFVAVEVPNMANYRIGVVAEHWNVLQVSQMFKGANRPVSLGIVDYIGANVCPSNINFVFNDIDYIVRANTTTGQCATIRSVPLGVDYTTKIAALRIGTQVTDIGSMLRHIKSPVKIANAAMSVRQKPAPRTIVMTFSLLDEQDANVLPAVLPANCVTAMATVPITVSDNGMFTCVHPDILKGEWDGALTVQVDDISLPITLDVSSLPDKKEGLGAGIIAAIVCGCVAVVAIAVGGSIYIVKYCRRAPSATVTKSGINDGVEPEEGDEDGSPKSDGTAKKKKGSDRNRQEKNNSAIPDVAEARPDLEKTGKAGEGLSTPKSPVSVIVEKRISPPIGGVKAPVTESGRGVAVIPIGHNHRRGSPAPLGGGGIAPERGGTPRADHPLRTQEGAVISDISVSDTAGSDSYEFSRSGADENSTDVVNEQEHNVSEENSAVAMPADSSESHGDRASFPSKSPPMGSPGSFPWFDRNAAK